MIKQKYKLENRIGRDVISIDPKTSKDFDDAFGMIENKNQYIISIYITNVSMWLDVMNVWSSFTERVSTIYLPDRKRPMLPTILSDTLCSLKENDIKFAFTLDLYIDKETNTLNTYKFTNTMINIKKNYVYDTDKQENDELYLKILPEFVSKCDNLIKLPLESYTLTRTMHFLGIPMRCHAICAFLFFASLRLRECFLL